MLALCGRRSNGVNMPTKCIDVFSLLQASPAAVSDLCSPVLEPSGGELFVVAPAGVERELGEDRGEHEKTADQHERSQDREMGDQRHYEQHPDSASEVSDAVHEREAGGSRARREALGRERVGHRHPHVKAKEDDRSADECDRAAGAGLGQEPTRFRSTVKALEMV